MPRDSTPCISYTSY